ncbi:hypothetical protein HYQ46_006232 [Verticillium longisporum]|nr:hypothetical protein HYQ46_006232 [Verticillium longisporum]
MLRYGDCTRFNSGVTGVLPELCRGPGVLARVRIESIVARDTVRDMPLTGLLPLLLRLVLPLLRSSPVLTRDKTIENSSSNGTASSSPSPSLGNRSPLERYESDVSPDPVVPLRFLPVATVRSG